MILPVFASGLTSSSGLSAGATAAAATGAHWPGLATPKASPIDNEDSQARRCMKNPPGDRRGRLESARLAVHGLAPAALATHSTRVRSLFVTRLYEAEVAEHALLSELAHSIRSEE